MDADLDHAIFLEERRHLQAILSLGRRWPGAEVQLAFALLASAVAVCDRLGLDAEGWLRELRHREPAPPRRLRVVGRPG